MTAGKRLAAAVRDYFHARADWEETRWCCGGECDHWSYKDFEVQEAVTGVALALTGAASAPEEYGPEWAPFATLDQRLEGILKSYPHSSAVVLNKLRAEYTTAARAA